MDHEFKGGELKQIGVRLRKDLWDELDRYYQKTRISKTAIIEMALKDYLEKLKD